MDKIHKYLATLRKEIRRRQSKLKRLAKARAKNMVPLSLFSCLSVCLCDRQTVSVSACEFRGSVISYQAEGLL